MSTTTTSNLILKLVDDSNDTLMNVTLPLPEVTQDTANIIRQNAIDKIQAFNTAAADTNSSVYKTFTTEETKPLKGIGQAILRMQTEEDIYNA